MALTDFVRYNSNLSSVPTNKYGAHIRSTPGGLNSHDFHWSSISPPGTAGGMYSPEFISYDKWGNSEPRHVFGFDNTKDMIPPSRYAGEQQTFPIPIKNYDLLHYPQDRPIMNTKNPNIDPNPVPNREHFSTTTTVSIWQIIIIQICVLLILYLLDKTFGKYITDLNIMIKTSIMVVIIILLILVAIGVIG